MAVRRIDAEESAILVNAVVGGGLDEPMLDFFRAPLGTKEETVAERAVDERFSRLLGRKVHVWVKNGDELTPEEDRVWHALFWQRDWWRATSFWKTVDEGDGVKGVYLDEGKLALMWEIYQAAEDLLGERSEDPLAVMRTAVFGQPYDVEANENEFWREATEFFWSQP